MADRIKPAAGAQSSPWPFEVGDVVQLKSGGGKMVVSELMCSGYVRVRYWCTAPNEDVGHVWEDDFDPLLLHRVEPVRADEEYPF